MTEDELKALFLLANFPLTKYWPILNGYWGNSADAPPWWLVKTSLGIIMIGWRKRVINIEWSDTPIRELLTEKDVTKDLTMVHAYGYGDAISYLQALKLLISRHTHMAANPDHLTDYLARFPEQTAQYAYLLPVKADNA